MKVLSGLTDSFTPLKEMHLNLKVIADRKNDSERSLESKLFDR